MKYAKMLKYFICCLKSNEAEDRQILSIDSQSDELKRFRGTKRHPDPRNIDRSEVCRGAWCSL